MTLWTLSSDVHNRIGHLIGSPEAPAMRIATQPAQLK